MTIEAVLSEVDTGLDASLERLFELLRLKSISTDPAYKDDCRATGEWLVAELNGLGFDASLRDTPGHPMVVAHDKGQEGAPHVLFYGHYDVQPVDPIELWDRDPFDPSIKTMPDGSKRIMARGAVDDKGQLMTFVEACRAWKKANGKLPLNVTIFLEGEEESGSPSLGGFLAENGDELKADVALVCDTGMWDKTTPAITTMLRGLVGEIITIRAADQDLHSGLFGGAARNPIHVLSTILADLHDENGRVMVPGFYEGVHDLPPDVKRMWDSLDFSAEEFLGGVNLSEPAGEKDYSVLEQIASRPTAEVNGIHGGYTGDGFKTVIASEAHAKVSFRLVGDQDPAKVRAAFRKFVQDRLPSDCEAEFHEHGGSGSISLSYENVYVQKAKAALSDEWNKEAVVVGMGGSIPVVGDFKDKLGMDSLLIGFGLEDDRMHSPNEKYDMTSFHGGIRSWARVLEALS